MRFYLGPSFFENMSKSLNSPSHCCPFMAYSPTQCSSKPKDMLAATLLDEEERQWECLERLIDTSDEEVKQAVAKMTLIILIKLCQEGE